MGWTVERLTDVMGSGHIDGSGLPPHIRAFDRHLERVFVEKLQEECKLDIFFTEVIYKDGRLAIVSTEPLEAMGAPQGGHMRESVYAVSFPAPGGSE